MQESSFEVVILLHAIFGMIALVAGGGSISVRKGSKPHVFMGKVFVVSMLISAISAMIIAVLPGHENPFLFSIGIFSSYFVLGGIRSKKYANPNINLTFDKIVSGAMLATGLVMVAFPIVLYGKINIVLTVFGIMGAFSSIMDFKAFSNREKLRTNWLPTHIGKMMGGYISASTAFVVVNELLPGVWAWFGPTIPGTIFISYWISKVKKKNK
jgi:uncharacterized membrane protein